MFMPSEIWVTELAVSHWMSQRIIQRASEATNRRVRLVGSLESARLAARALSRAEQKQVLIVADRPPNWIRREKFSGLCGRQQTYVVTLGTGCPYDCTYCYLQMRDKVSCPTLFVDVDDLIRELEKAGRKELIPRGALLNAAEDGEPLALEWMSGLAGTLLDRLPDDMAWKVELRTKCNDVSSSLCTEHACAATIGFSLNSTSVITSFEKGCPSLEERLDCARACQDRGLATAIKLEPMIQTVGWETGYRNLIEEVRQVLDPKKIDHFSLGSLRLKEELRKRILRNHGGRARALVETELEEVAPNRFSYPTGMRVVMYESIRSHLSRCFPSVPVYLSLEASTLCKRLAMASEQPTIAY